MAKWKWSQESCEKLSKSMKQRCQDPLVRAKRSESAKRQWADPTLRKKMVEADLKSWENGEYRTRHVAALNTPEYLKSRSEISKRLWNNPLLREKAAKRTKEALGNPEVRQKMSISHIGLKLSAESREKVSKAKKGRRQPWMEGDKNPSKSLEARKKISLALRGKKHPWSAGDRNPLRRPEILEKFKKVMNSPEMREKRSLNAVRLWQDSTFQKKIAEGRKAKPNNLEIAFTHFLESIFPNTWEYVGNFTFFVGHKNPDYRHKGEMKLIELFGDYWHQGENPQERIDYYKKHGYGCLIIWQSEFENEREEVESKVLDFNATSTPLLFQRVPDQYAYTECAKSE